MLYLNICGGIWDGEELHGAHLEEDEESPEAEQKADPAKELDEGVRIISCWMIVLDSTRNHHLQSKVLP